MPLLGKTKAELADIVREIANSSDGTAEEQMLSSFTNARQLAAALGKFLHAAELR
jgi:hypothetical protein